MENESKIFDIIFDKLVNMSLIRSLKKASDYNKMVSLDPKRHLTDKEFKIIKKSYTAFLEDKSAVQS